jgi:DNA replication protein DnaC
VAPLPRRQESSDAVSSLNNHILLQSIDFCFIKNNNRLMKTDIRFLNEVVRIVNGALRLDVDKVRNYTAFLAEKLDDAGEKTTANHLRKLLVETDNQLRPADVRFSNKALPVDSESRFPLVERVNLKGLSEPPLNLLQSQWDVVNEFVSISKSYGAFDASDSASAMSFLMYGPPGTGKNRLARYIASELGLELYVARLDGLISSYLGSTAKNIRALFDFAAKTPCVLFLDEFDAIAKVRSDDQELGELKRVVNSFLQNLDTVGKHSIILAATNHELLLDPAVWRRFTYRVALQLPNLMQRTEMWAQFISPIELTSRDLVVLADLSEGFSGSDIRETCARLKRRLFASGKQLEMKDAFMVLQNLSIAGSEERCFASSLTNKDSIEIIRLLRERDQKLYSLAMLAELLGSSKATIHRLAKKEGVSDGE